MKRIVYIFTIVFFLLTLASCASLDSQQAKTDKRTAGVNSGAFDAWNDGSLNNAAISELIKQADMMIKYKQWDDAQGKLERTLRLSTSYSPAWSRLSWLSLRAAKFKKAVQLAHRSNSYTDDRSLKILNWSFIRDAYQLMGDNQEVETANSMLQRLSETGL